MKKVTKIITILITAIFVIAFVCMTAFANEASTQDTVEVESGDVNSETTLFQRVWEFVVSNKTEILQGALYIVSVVFGTFLYKKSNNNSIKLIGGVNNLVNATDANEKTNRAYIEAINITGDNVSELYELCNAKFNELAAELKQDSKLLIDGVTEIMTVLEILMAVYPNAKNLPQGVKDLIALKYAKCKELVGSDERMSSVLNVIHGIINGVDEKTHVEAVN